MSRRKLILKNLYKSSWKFLVFTLCYINTAHSPSGFGIHKCNIIKSGIVKYTQNNQEHLTSKFMSKIVMITMNKINNMYAKTGGSPFSFSLKPESYSNSPMTITNVLRSPKPGVLNDATCKNESR